jgi:hypothetical protein
MTNRRSTASRYESEVQVGVQGQIRPGLLPARMDRQGTDTRESRVPRRSTACPRFRISPGSSVASPVLYTVWRGWPAWQPEYGNSSVLLRRKYKGIRDIEIKRYEAATLHSTDLDHPRVSSSSKPLVAYRHDIVFSILQHPSAALTQVFIELDERGSFPDLHISLS